MFDELSKARTYFLFDGDAAEENRLEIMAYFAVALQVLRLPDNMSVRQTRSLDGFSGKLNGSKIKFLPVYLIGQLAKNDSYNDKISGNEILEYAMQVIMRARIYAGGRVAMVEAKTSAKGLLQFYEKNGFAKIFDNEETGLTQMIHVFE